MTRKAYNTVTWQGRQYRQAIVEFDPEGRPLTVQEFQEEQPFTEWVGGHLEI